MQYLEFSAECGAALSSFALIHQAVHGACVRDGVILAVDFPQVTFLEQTTKGAPRAGLIGPLMRVFGETAGLQALLKRQEVRLAVLSSEAAVSGLREIPVGVDRCVQWRRSRDVARSFSLSRIRRHERRARAREEAVAEKSPRSQSAFKPHVFLELRSFSSAQRIVLHLSRELVDGPAQLGAPTNYGLSAGTTWLPILS